MFLIAQVSAVKYASEIWSERVWSVRGGKEAVDRFTKQQGIGIITYIPVTNWRHKNAIITCYRWHRQFAIYLNAAEMLREARICLA